MDDQCGLPAEIRRSVDGDPWYGPSALAVLEDVDAATAAARPPRVAHSIWEIVRHMASWTRYLAFRLRGGAPGEPPDGDWPPVGDVSREAWADAIAELTESRDDLLEALGTVPIEMLREVGAETPRDSVGEPVTLLRALVGLPQHHAYHCGQIAVLKRAAAPAKGPDPEVPRL